MKIINSLIVFFCLLTFVSGYSANYAVKFFDQEPYKGLALEPELLNNNGNVAGEREVDYKDETFFIDSTGNVHTLPNETRDTCFMDFNDLDQVLYSDDNDQFYIWDKTQGSVPLNVKIENYEIEPVAMNNKGQVVIVASPKDDANELAASEDSFSDYIDWNVEYPVVASENLFSCDKNLYFISENNMLTPIEIYKLIDSTFCAYPVTINDKGQVLFMLVYAEDDFRLGFCVWDQGTLIHKHVPNDKQQLILPLCMNNLGDVVGVQSRESGNDTGMIWMHDGRTVSFEEQETEIVFTAINDLGQAVGLRAKTENSLLLKEEEIQTRAIIWDQENGIRDLNDMITLSEGDKDRVLTGAKDINNRGQILVEGETKGHEFCALLTQP